MKHKIIVSIISLMIICIYLTGCKAENAADENENYINPEENISNESGVIPAENAYDTDNTGNENFQVNENEQNIESENNGTAEQQFSQTDTVLTGDDMIYMSTVLTSQVQNDKVCIVVFPSVLRKYNFYYYIPDDKDQEWLKQHMDTISLEERHEDRELLKETGWQIAYEDKCFMAYEGGYIEYSCLDEKGNLITYYAEAPKLCDYIQIMLQEKLEYFSFNPAEIKDIMSARLDAYGKCTNNEFYSQTITDMETLKLFESWFSNAKYIYGGADCGNQNACLELVLADGEIVRLSMATDSCSNFGINGLYYDYSPVSGWDNWDNKEFFNLFDEIPWNWQ